MNGEVGYLCLVVSGEGEMKEDRELPNVKGQSSNRKDCGSLYLSHNVHSTAVKAAFNFSRGYEKA